MRGNIQRRVSPTTGRVTYRPRVYLGKREAERAGLAPGVHHGGTFDRLRPHKGEPCAEDGLADLKADLARRIAGEKAPVRACTDTVAVVSRRWLRDGVRPDRRANTVRAHEMALANHILAVPVRCDTGTAIPLGELVACEVTPADVAEWQASELATGAAVKSVRNYRGTLHRMYAWLSVVMPETFAVNPVAQVPTPTLPRRRVEPPSLAEAQQYVEALRETRTEVREGSTHRFGVHFTPSRLWPAVVLGSCTGMRRGEVLAVRWSDADWHAEKTDGGVRLVGGIRIHPRRGNLTGRGREGLRFGPPKTAAGARYVPLTEAAIAALIEVKAERMRQLRPGQAWDEEALICCGRKGQPIVPDGLTHELALRFKRRGLPPVSFHQLRHMVATEMRRAGVPSTVLAGLLGHADVATTAIYDHVDESDQRAASDLFGAAWKRAEQVAGEGPDAPAEDELSRRRHG